MKEKPTTQEPEVIKADFDIRRLQMDYNLTWLLDLEIKKVLPETSLRYNLELVFNEQPYIDSIEQIEGRILEKENEKDLFDGSLNKQHIKQMRQQIIDVLEEMKALKEDCPTIQMETVVTEIKYKTTGVTFIRMHLPDSKINELNENKRKFKYYCAELTPKAE